MLLALATDFLRLPETAVTVLRDARLADQRWPESGQPALADLAARVIEIHSADDERAALQQLAREADWTLLIAPEFEELLSQRCRLVEAAGGRLLSPDSAFVALAADKQRCCARLRQAGIPVPQGRLLAPHEPLPADFPFPAVLKPNDGAGSRGIQLLTRPTEPFDASDLGPAARLEEFQPGLAASVAVLCGPHRPVPLPACRQRLSDDGRFSYLGGETPLPAPLQQRAKSLALAAVQALPPVRGYVGVDLVLGEAADGSGDVVIEINPRLTTSYIGLRALAETNLAAAMLAVAQGESVELSYLAHAVQFEADGQYRLRAQVAE